MDVPTLRTVLPGATQATVDQFREILHTAARPALLHYAESARAYLEFLILVRRCTGKRNGTVSGCLGRVVPL